MNFCVNFLEGTIKPNMNNKYQGRIELILGPMFSGKCLAKGMRVLKYDGDFVCVETLKPNDILMGDDSTPRKVLGVCNGVGDMYRISPKGGSYGFNCAESYVVNDKHILSLMLSTTVKTISNLGCSVRVKYIQDHECKSKSFSVKTYGTYKKALKSAESFLSNVDMNVKGEIIDISIDDYIKKSKEWKRYYKGYQVGVEYNNCVDPDIDPYFIGLWLGDGTKSKPLITTADDEIRNYLKTFADIMNVRYVRNDLNISLSKKTGSDRFNPVLTILKKMNLINNKHIPESLLKSSRESRLAILAGLLDSDGYFSNNCSYEIVQKREELSKNIVTLCRSLGYRCSIMERFVKCTNSTNPDCEHKVYRMYIGGPNLMDIPLKIKRKQYSGINHKPGLMTTIDVESIGEGEYYGFELDGNGRFLLEDFTVTHNSSALISKMDRHLIAKKKVIAIKHSSDTRYTEDPQIVTHSGMSCPCIVCDDHLISFDDNKKPEIYKQIQDYEVVCIDEGSFFKDIVRFCEMLANNGHHVIVASLDGTSDRVGFNDILNLVPKAEDKHFLKAVCMKCHKDGASFTKRIVPSTETILVGGNESYAAVCRKCFFADA